MFSFEILILILIQYVGMGEWKERAGESYEKLCQEKE